MRRPPNFMQGVEAHSQRNPKSATLNLDPALRIETVERLRGPNLKTRVGFASR